MNQNHKISYGYLKVLNYTLKCTDILYIFIPSLFLATDTLS